MLGLFPVKKGVPLRMSENLASVFGISLVYYINTKSVPCHTVCTPVEPDWPSKLRQLITRQVGYVLLTRRVWRLIASSGISKNRIGLSDSDASIII
jgi:hypothetical protein